ncbi:hypothetical protein [Noviherbaspirillum aerium]|uniref:hypothetical protein n=1 Tax=Noviherbaspirillum aerium TaxID=2588497 RepID=UPI00124D5F68|nr:hypothetical protein [Noviherbaspirillum aerium]
MPDPVTRKTHKYDPDNFKVPEFRKDKDGNFAPTDYQTAVALKDFMKRNDMLFLTYDQMWEAVQKGTVTNGDRVTQVNDREKAMFDALRWDGLIARIDAADGKGNGVHDKILGGDDIDAAIKNGFIHADKASPDRHWKDPMSRVTIPKPEAKERLVAFMEGGHGGLSDGDIVWDKDRVSEAIEHHRSVNNKGYVNIDNPALIEAFMLFNKDFDNVDGNTDGFINLEELKNWKV